MILYWTAFLLKGFFWELCELPGSDLWQEILQLNWHWCGEMLLFANLLYASFIRCHSALVLRECSVAPWQPFHELGLLQFTPPQDEHSPQCNTDVCFLSRLRGPTLPEKPSGFLGYATPYKCADSSAQMQWMCQSSLPMPNYSLY